LFFVPRKKAILAQSFYNFGLVDPLVESSTSVTATGRTIARVDQARQVRSKVNGIVFDQTDANQRTGLKRVITFTGLAELTKSMLKHMFQRPLA
jgi:hypothetical protein